MLSKSWNDRKKKYDFAVIGSGYGGAIMAARISGANLNPKPSVCILERGKEWEVGKFPDEPLEVVGQTRNPITNPLGLYEFLAFPDISVIQGSGLGGTSLINANVAIIPDEEVFGQIAWPQRIKLNEMLPYYARASQMLAVAPHPKANDLLKVKALGRRAQEIGNQAVPLNIAVNFTVKGKNAHGVEQKPCIDCGDCVTGCNVGAKNTLYMNYLPVARKNGTDIFTQVNVDWIEKTSDGWKIRGRRFPKSGFPEEFTLDAANVILSAGSLGTTEILLRSEMHGLELSPRVGTSFNGNGDFFGLAYNSDFQTNVLGFGKDPDHFWRKAGNAPGPNIVGAIRYDKNLPFDKRITVEDFSFPKAYVGAAMAAFGAIGGQDTDLGDEQQEAERRLLDNPFQPYKEHNAMNHTMLYLVMGHDDAKGTIHLRTNVLDHLGRIEIDWDDVGRQPIFTRMNEEIRRHARTLGAHFLPNPLWNFVTLRNLITAHPLGGCPMGDDHLQGAVDEFGRVFAADGSIHKGLFVADGSIVPSALGVNPFLTISALSERIADRLVRSLGGEPYPAAPASVSVSGFDPLEVLDYKEADLERIFSRVETKKIDNIVNTGQRAIDLEKGIIHNDTVWKGFFPRGHILNQMSTAFFAGFKKKFTKAPDGYIGVTSDSDERINVRNTLQEITIEKRTGSLEPGKYILLRYTEPPWNVFYDIFKFVNDDLLIGRVYLGEFPNGVRMFTFPMTRSYGLDNMTVDDHRALYQSASVPTKEQLAGLWEMRMIANANNTGVVAYLKFDYKPDGRLEARYRLLGLLEGMSEPVFTPEHFQLNDFTPFHDEIRFLDKDFLIGKYTTASPPGLMQLLGPSSLGLFHQETSAGGTPQFSFYYTLRRSEMGDLPPTVFLQPLLDVRLPDGLGMTFDEEMIGRYYPDFSVPAGRDGDLQIEEKFFNLDQSGEGVDCSFKVRMTIGDLNEFVESSDHEARLQGTIHFGDFRGRGPATFVCDSNQSYFNYLRVNPETGEAEMLYRIYFRDDQNTEYLFHGRKYMQKDHRGGIVGAQEILYDYTTLYCHLTETATGKELGSGLLKFKTFEDLEAVGSFANFLTSFQVTGTDNPVLKAQGQLRFMALTNQFVIREYDPLNIVGGFMADEVREAVLRGAETPDHFATQPASELQVILRESTTLPLETLLNHGGVEIDFDNRRIYRDSFWKGSFTNDSVLGWKERIRNAGLGRPARRAAKQYIGGSFWKRFDKIEGGEARGYVINYDLDFLPGKPVVKQVKYPDNNRSYFKAGDDVLLLTYTNEPYRIVYDVIKVIDKNNAIGVMHLGDFPNGLEFTTFVMARHNYPFENMSVPDHQAIFNSDRTRVPSPAEVAGTWDGHLIFLTRPDVSLLNRLNPVAFRLRFIPTTNGVEGRYRFGIVSGQMGVEFTDEFVRLNDFSAFHDEIRMIDGDTMIGKWVSAPSEFLNAQALRTALEGYLEPGRNEFAFYYILKRV